MPPIRVLVVDDSVVVRRLLTEALAHDPDLVVTTASSGSVALAKVEQANPDLVTLDVEMEGLSGLETLALLKKARPALPVIMFSAYTVRGANSTIEALLLGASDYVTKPSQVGSAEEAQRRVRADLLPRIKALCKPQAPAPPSPPSPESRATPGGPIDLVTIGVSTGGPNALAELVPRLPSDLPAAVLIVQHMPPVFTRSLAEALAAKSSVPVAEARDGVVIEPGKVWIAPGDHHLVVARKGNLEVLELTREPPENSCRPAVDVLFRSAARVYGRRALGLVLTGMGQDGLRGCEHLREAGAEIVVQDEATSVVWGMPGFVARAGLASAVLPLSELAPDLVRRVLESRRRAVSLR